MDLVIRALEAGITVVTVNRRLTDYWQRQVARNQLAAGHTAWPTPRIFALSGLLHIWWNELLEVTSSANPVHPIALLTANQEQLCWEGIIAADSESRSLLDVSAAAKQAMEARQLLRQWRLTLTETETLDHRDGEAFLRWLTSFEGRCRDERWLTQADLPDWILSRLPQLTLPEGILTLGFDEFTPQHTAFWSALGAAGVRFWPVPPPNPPGEVLRIRALDPEGELQLVAEWARDGLERDPGARIGIVLPQVATRRRAVERHLQESLDPEGMRPEGSKRSPLFNLSLGGSLADEPLVRDGLFLLSLAEEGLTGERYGRLLLTPFLGGGRKEWWPRAALDARLRESGRWRLTMTELRGMASDCPILARVLADFSRALAVSGIGAASGFQWTVRCTSWLRALGWPGDGVRTSRELQVMIAWQGLLAELAADDLVHPAPRSLGVVMRRLHRLAAATLFQPEGGADAPVQVLGILEAAGERFDQLWLPGLNDEEWPPTAMPNPFLPFAWQRRLGLPRSSGQRELAFAQRVTDRLLTSAERIVISHAEREGDRDLRVSPLVAVWPSWTVAEGAMRLGLDLVRPPSLAARIQLSSRLESREEATAPPWPGDDTPVFGGAALLQAQSLCPFQAFARYRLDGRPLVEPVPYPDPGQRGSLVHWAVANFWQGALSLQALQAMTGDEQERLLREAVAKAVAEGSRRWPDRLWGASIQLEEERLRRLLRRWLVVEEERQLPFQVEAQERDGHCHPLGRLHLTLRPDRVDLLADGERIILDYKTGRPEPGDWFGERPRDPQLPLYCLAAAEPVAAVAFVRMRPEQVGFKGLAREAGLLPGVKGLDVAARYELTSWEAIQDHWREGLHRLADEFLAGVATVSPQPKACDLCDLGPLCRIGETELGEESVAAMEEE